MNFMKCHFKEWMWVAITIQSGFLVDGMASFVHPAVGETAKPPEELDWFETLMHTHS